MNGSMQQPPGIIYSSLFSRPGADWLYCLGLNIPRPGYSGCQRPAKWTNTGDLGRTAESTVLVRILGPPRPAIFTYSSCLDGPPLAHLCAFTEFCYLKQVEKDLPMVLLLAMNFITNMGAVTANVSTHFLFSFPGHLPVSHSFPSILIWCSFSDSSSSYYSLPIFLCLSDERQKN